VTHPAPGNRFFSEIIDEMIARPFTASTSAAPPGDRVTFDTIALASSQLRSDDQIDASSYSRTYAETPRYYSEIEVLRNRLAQLTRHNTELENRIRRMSQVAPPGPMYRAGFRLTDEEILRELARPIEAVQQSNSAPIPISSARDHVFVLSVYQESKPYPRHWYFESQAHLDEAKALAESWGYNVRSAEQDFVTCPDEFKSWLEEQ
jgi:hypothetical protein